MSRKGSAVALQLPPPGAVPLFAALGDATRPRPLGRLSAGGPESIPRPREGAGLTRRSDELARRRQQLPWVRIDKQYKFDTEEGSASLADLFRGRSQLLIYHFMFGPDYTAGCPSCSAIADGFDGSVVHLANHDVTLDRKSTRLNSSHTVIS